MNSGSKIPANSLKHSKLDDSASLNFSSDDENNQNLENRPTARSSKQKNTGAKRSTATSRA